jgi:hypothetical protein
MKIGARLDSEENLDIPKTVYHIEGQLSLLT